jgi:hypothetical protein
MEEIYCETHGLQQQTWVCQHIAQGLFDRSRAGFFWASEDADNPRPDAWCIECNERVKVTSGEWVDEALDQLKPKCLCGACYDLAKAFHSGGDPWS